MFQHRATSVQPPNRRYSSLSHFLPAISFPVEAFSVVVRRLQVAAFGPTAPLAFLRGPTVYLLISTGLARRRDFLACIFRHWPHQFSSWRESLEFFCSSQVRIPEAAKARGIRRLR